MKTISISRLAGSEAGTVALRLSRTLEYDLIDKKILEAIFQQYGLTRFGDLYSTPPNIWDLGSSNNLQIVSLLNDTMEALAQRGRSVILGRGAYASLSRHAKVLNVRLQSPFDIRVKRLMAREGLTDRKQTEANLAKDDKARMKFVERFFGHKWDTASDFDLVVDTHTVSVEMTVDWILEALRSQDTTKPSSEYRKEHEAKIDPLLYDSIEYALSRRIPSWEDRYQE